MSLFRRALLLWLLMFWQGGFMFYGAVVVPIGTEALGSAEEQGWITRLVTNGINLAAVPALAAWAWDLAAEPAATRRRQAWSWLLWGLIVALLAALAWLHVCMDGVLDLDAFRVLDRPAFRSLHRWYLRLTTAQWLACILLTYWTLRAWRDADARRQGPGVSAS